ncbi:hypothetical protein N7513_003292 [Penicillium frequentans]|nr:hypothetical protein N7513_003292 [Penicillium glabrum]
MLGKDCNEKLEIENGLWKINAIKSVFEDFVAEYRRTKPRIHAEVQVLEHFYINKMVFAENDPYIACSKPACLCCEMYFKYHPARMIVPESHRNIWANWGPPIVENYSKWTPAGRRQLDILNSMIQELREMIIREALGQSRAGNWHPDSMTGITEIYHYDQLNNFNNFIPDKVLASRVGDSELSVDLEKARDSEDDSDIDDGGVSINS